MCLCLCIYIKITVKRIESVNVRGSEGKHGEGWKEGAREGTEESSLSILAPRGKEGDDATVL